MDLLKMSYLIQSTVNSNDMYEIKMIYSDQVTPGQLRFMECIVNKSNSNEVYPIIQIPFRTNRRRRRANI